MMNMFGMGVFGWLMMLLFLALVIAGLIYLVRYFSESDRQGQRQNRDAPAIARERYARGEISEQEYQAIRQNLER